MTNERLVSWTLDGGRSRLCGRTQAALLLALLGVSFAGVASGQIATTIQEVFASQTLPSTAASCCPGPILPDVLPVGYVGASYSVVFTDGGCPGYWGYTGSLPPGLIFHSHPIPKTAVSLSGVPTTPGIYAFIVGVSVIHNPPCPQQRAYLLQILSATPTPTFTPTLTPTHTPLPTFTPRRPSRPQ